MEFLGRIAGDGQTVALVGQNMEQDRTVGLFREFRGSDQFLEITGLPMGPR